MKHPGFWAGVVTILMLSVVFTKLQVKKPPAGLSGRQKAWYAQAVKIGADRTYVGFKADQDQSPYGQRHNLTHEFGEFLYRTYGAVGIKICDGFAEFGCYHGLSGLAVASEGLTILTRLRDGCVDKWGRDSGPCQHGIGHGVMSYLGYDKLPEALTACEMIPMSSPIGGCTSGVLMEYNYHTMENNVGRVYRQLDKNNIYTPCATLPEKFLPACYYEQTQWWLDVYAGDYRQVGQLCAGLGSRELQRVCFRGIGNIAAASTRTLSGVTERCDQMKMAGDPQRWCRIEASWSLLSNTGDRQMAAESCRGVTEDPDLRCVDL